MKNEKKKTHAGPSGRISNQLIETIRNVENELNVLAQFLFPHVWCNPKKNFRL